MRLIRKCFRPGFHKVRPEPLLAYDLALLGIFKARDRKVIVANEGRQGVAIAGVLFLYQSAISEPVAAQTASRCMMYSRASSRHLILYG